MDSRDVAANSGGSGVPDIEAMFERLPIAIYRSHPDGHLLAGNAALASLLGYDSVDELAQMTDVSTLYVDPSIRKDWLRRTSESGRSESLEFELRRRDGQTIWVQDMTREIRDESGNVIYYEGALIDVTEKVNARKARDEFIAAVSHELRNPIAVMLGLGQELAKKYDSFNDEERRELAGIFARQAEDAAWLIEDLLVAYREGSGTLATSSETFDVIEAVERVLEAVERPIGRVWRSGPHPARGDPRRTRQIIRNLVSNAIKYGGDSIEVRIEPTATGQVEISVCDSGEPIDRGELERIFKPFERGSAQDHPGSIGLGLAVARKLAELLGGSLEYRHDGSHSCFVLTLSGASS